MSKRAEIICKVVVVFHGLKSPGSNSGPASHNAEAEAEHKPLLGGSSASELEAAHSQSPLIHDSTGSTVGSNFGSRARASQGSFSTPDRYRPSGRGEGFGDARIAERAPLLGEAGARAGGSGSEARGKVDSDSDETHRRAIEEKLDGCCDRLLSSCGCSARARATFYKSKDAFMTAMKALPAGLAALYMAYVYEKMSRHSSEEHMSGDLSRFFAVDSSGVNAALFFTSFLDVPATFMGAYQDLSKVLGGECSGAMLAGVLFLPLAAWAAVAAVPIYASSVAVLPHKILGDVAWALRGLLVFRSLLKSPKIIGALAAEIKEANQKIAAGENLEASKIIGKLILSLLLAVAYTFTQHTSITKGLNTLGSYESDIPLGGDIFMELIGAVPLGALNTDFIRDGMTQLFSGMGALPQAFKIMFGGDTEAATRSWDSRLDEGFGPVCKFLVTLLAAGASGFPAVTLALTGVSNDKSAGAGAGAGAGIPRTALPFEKGEGAYPHTAAVVSYGAASLMNIPGFEKVYDKTLWPILRGTIKGVSYIPGCAPLGQGVSRLCMGAGTGVKSVVVPAAGCLYSVLTCTFLRQSAAGAEGYAALENEGEAPIQQSMDATNHGRRLSNASDSAASAVSDGTENTVGRMGQA